MNENIKQILSEMDRYMPVGRTMIAFLYEHKKMIRFNITLSTKDMAEDINILDLSARAHNCLRRAGVRTIGDLAKAICEKDEETSKTQLLRFRNLGRKTADEIVLLIMCYQFRILSEDGKRRYVQEIVSLNGEAA